MHDTILAAKDNVVIPRVHMAVRSITESSERDPCSMVRNSDQREFTGNTENTPLMSASNRILLNVNQDRNDETPNVENIEIGDFLALRTNYDRIAQAYYTSGRGIQSVWWKNCWSR